MESERILATINLACYLIVARFIEFFIIGDYFVLFFHEKLFRSFFSSNMHERIPVRFSVDFGYEIVSNSFIRFHGTSQTLSAEVIIFSSAHASTMKPQSRSIISQLSPFSAHVSILRFFISHLAEFSRAELSHDCNK